MSMKSSPKKKVTSKDSSESVKISPSTEDVPDWDGESSNKLLTRISELINKPDTLKYTSQLEKLSWEKVQFDSYTAEQCKSRWVKLSKEVRKFRTLSELVNDARDYLKDPYKGQIKKHPEYPKRPLTPYFRFFMEKRDSYASKHKHLSNLEVTADLSKKYRELPAKKKERYIEQWQKQHQEFLKAMQKFKEEHPNYFQEVHKPPVEPRTPVCIMKDDRLKDYMKQNTKLTKKEAVEALKKMYKSLADDQKQIYIAKALDEKQVYKKEMEIFLKKNPTYVRKNEKQVLTKYEKKLNDRNLGKPEKPPSNGYNLFCIETMPNLKSMLSQKRIVECGRLWNLLEKDKKDHYHNRFLDMKKKYENEYKTYLQSLTPDERAEEERLMKSKKSNRSTPLPSFVVLKSEKEQNKQTNSLGTSGTGGKDDTSSDDSSVDDDDDDDEDGSLSESSDNEEDNTNMDGDVINTESSTAGKDMIGIPPRPTTPISALFLYQKAHRKQVAAQYSWMTKDDITRLLARRYQELPKHKRYKYVRKEREQRAIYAAKMQQYYRDNRNRSTNGEATNETTTTTNENDEQLPEPPVQPQAITGEQLYHEKIYPVYCKKFEGDDKAVEHAMHMAWNKLNKSRREPYIKKAQKENEENIIKYSEAKKKYDDEVMRIESVKSSSTNIQAGSGDTTNTSGKEVRTTTTRTRKIKFEGQPKKPPTNGYQLFNSIQMLKLTHLSHSEKFKEIGRLWTGMEVEKKETFSKEVQRQNDKYKKEMELWLKTLPPEKVVEFHLQQRGKRRGKTSSDVAASKKTKTTATTKPTTNNKVVLKEVKEERPDDEIITTNKKKIEEIETSSSSSDEESDSDDDNSSSSSSDDDDDDNSSNDGDDSSSSDSSDDDDDDDESGSSSSSSSESTSNDEDDSSSDDE